MGVGGIPPDFDFGPFSIIGGDGADRLTGGDLGDPIFGRGGDDELFGRGGDDQIFGEDGDDLIDGGPGRDVMAGGPGNDAFFVDDPGDVVVEQRDAGFDTIDTVVALRLPAHVERLTLSGPALVGVGNLGANTIIGNGLDNTLVGEGGNDVLAGGAGRDRLVGGSGRDRLSGGAGVDVLEGGPGRDVLDGGAGRDTMKGGGGDDMYVVDRAGDAVVEGDAKGIDTVRSPVTFKLAAQVENLILVGSAAIDGTGNPGSNSLVGNGGDNVLIGGGGHDRLDGGAGADALFGGAGRDTVVGRAGGDALEGGAGRDVLSGGAGADTFRFAAIDDGAAIGGNVARGAVAGDRLADFVGGEDVMAFAAVFDPGGVLGPGTLTLGTSFSVIAVPYDGTNPGANANHAAGVATFVFSTADDTLHYDEDGADPGYTVVATLANGAEPSADDITVA
jgi:Ca2+-binding RTX toxin-like protein